MDGLKLKRTHTYTVVYIKAERREGRRSYNGLIYKETQVVYIINYWDNERL